MKTDNSLAWCAHLFHFKENKIGLKNNRSCFCFPPSNDWVQFFPALSKKLSKNRWQTFALPLPVCYSDGWVNQWADSISLGWNWQTTPVKTLVPPVVKIEAGYVTQACRLNCSLIWPHHLPGPRALISFMTFPQSLALVQVYCKVHGR